MKEAQELISHYLASLPLVTKFKEESKVIYESEDGKEEKVFDALEWLAVIGSHMPDKGKK